jgi:hypothetical protein
MVTRVAFDALKQWIKQPLDFRELEWFPHDYDIFLGRIYKV